MKIEISSVKMQLTAENEQLQKVFLESDALISEMQSFTSDETLQGDAYGSTKDYYTRIEIPLTKAMTNMYGEKIKANNRYSEALSSYFGGMTRIDQEELQIKKDAVTKQRKRLESLSRLSGSYNSYIRVLIQLENELEKQIQSVNEFNTATKNYYDDFQNKLSLVEQGMKSANSIPYDDASMTYNIPSMLDLKWAEESNKAWALRYDLSGFTINRPEGMTDSEFITYKLELSEQVGFLILKDGWDKAAVEAYISEVNKQMLMCSLLKNRNYFEKLRSVYGETKRVGSNIYTKMFEACKLSDKKKVNLVIKQMVGQIDNNGMLQLTRYGFDPKMPPHGKFLELYAECVQGAYGKDGLPNGNGGKKIHQLRMYIDKHNIEYIRNNYKKSGMTDEDALRAYVKQELNGKKMQAEKARLHNKFPNGTNYRDYVAGENNKKRLTPNFHSEYIIDCNGNFVSQWDVLEIDKNGNTIGDYNYYKSKYENNSKAWEKVQQKVMNTESFNYANKNGDKHKSLDMKPPSFHDTDLRKEINKGWKSPVLEGDSTIASENTYNDSSDKEDDYSK